MKLKFIKPYFKKDFIVNLILLYFLVLGLSISSWMFIRIYTPSSQMNQKPNQTNFQIYTDKSEIIQNYNVPQQNFLDQPSNNIQISTLNRSFFDVGHQRSFWIYDFASSSYSKINATLLSIGEKCYVYMQDYCITEIGEYFALRQAMDICDEFDNIIYPQITNLAGHPNGTLGDIDGDPRIIILVSNNPYSYYDQRNELDLEYSNLCEMFHFNYRTWLPTLAHEFHHLIWFNNEMDELHFTLEALAEYAMYYAGYLAPYNNKSPQTDLFLEHPEDSLLYWNMLNSIDYGGAYLFAFYIAEHYGVDILKNLITEPMDGAYGIENILKRGGYNITFNELYMNWITALTLDELGFENNLYGFENLNARVTKYNLIRDSDNVKLYYYGFNVHKVQVPSNKFTIQIRKDLDKTIGLCIAFQDSLGWHIYQNQHNKGIEIITANISGSEIDEMFIITSYIFERTPPSPSENGLGPFTYIEIVIDNLPGDSIIPVLTIAGTLTLALISIMIIIIKKNRKIEHQ